MDAFPKAKAAAMKALSIDESLAEAHTSLAATLWLHDWLLHVRHRGEFIGSGLTRGAQSVATS
jgi:hypothetical protein